MTRVLLISVLVLVACGVPVEEATDAGQATGGGTATGGGAATGGGGGEVDAGVLPTFSFFVTSYAALQVLSGSVNGFGGDLRYGETGLGAGLRGADKLCTTIAERSMPGAGAKVWRAFLSAHQGEDGGIVHAKDRIGSGPWYDRNGRLFAMDLASALTTRPTGCDGVICNDLPNEDGVPNHAPSGAQLDNHDVLTGTNAQGLLQTSRPNATCASWTTSARDAGQPQIGHAWPAMSGQSWMTTHLAGGCGAGVNLAQTGGPSEPTVGSGGGYGAIYCFALSP